LDALYVTFYPSGVVERTPFDCRWWKTKKPKRFAKGDLGRDENVICHSDYPVGYRLPRFRGLTVSGSQVVGQKESVSHGFHRHMPKAAWPICPMGCVCLLRYRMTVFKLMAWRLSKNTQTVNIKIT
jgi:hypothetical protein